MPSACGRWLFTVCAAAQKPYIYYRAIFNSGSYAAGALPGGSLARGSIFTLFGTNLGPDEPGQAQSFPLSTTLSGVSIKVSQGATSVDAFPFYVSSGQINALLPSNAPLGKVVVRVTKDGLAGSPSPAVVTESSVGIFTQNSQGFGPGIFQNFESEASQPLNTLTASARPGQVITLWGTGLGAIPAADNVAPPAGDLPVQVEVFVGGRSAKRLYSGRSPCCAGLDQIVFEIPADAPTGCWVPVQVRTDAKTPSNAATLSITASGSPCSEAGQPIATRMMAGGKLGVIATQRVEQIQFINPNSAPLTTADWAMATFREETQFQFHPVFSLPPAGTCTVYRINGDLLGGAWPAGFQPTGRELDAGAVITVAGTEVKKVTGPPGWHWGFLGFNWNAEGDANLKLGGASQISAPGGADVGAFQVPFSPASPIQWTNRESLLGVDRTKDLVVRWSGGDPETDTVVVAGVSVQLADNASALFVCSAQPQAGALTVPSYVLGSLPASPASPKSTDGVLLVGSAPLRKPPALSAPGLDAGWLLFTSWSSRTVWWY